MRGNKPFTAEQICAIIKECQGFGSIEVKYQDLHIVYRPLGPEDALNLSQIQDMGKDPVPNAIPTEWKDQASLIDERSLIEAEESQLQIENPAAYEQMQIDAYADKQKG